MAGITGLFFVFAGQFKIGLGVMVKLPDTPVVGRVALFATTAQRFFVNIVVLMAVAASQGSIFECLFQVALFTTGNRVLADQGEAGQIMVKTDDASKGLFIVAAVAAVTLLSFVDVVTFVTADTVRFKLVFEASLMAAMAFQGFMAAFEFEVGVPVVIEAAFLPVVFAMTVLTCSTIFALVGVIGTVAVDTLISG